MKKIKIFSFFLILFAAFNMISCGDTEPVDESVLNPSPTNPQGDCADPTAFQASDFISGTTVELNWIAGDDEVEWEVEYGPAGFDHGDGTIMVAQDTDLTITGLTSTNNYNFYLRAICPDGGYSNWIGPVSVGTGTTGCGLPSDLAAVRTEGNLTQVVVTWTPNGSAAQWEVEYGFAGHTPGTGTSFITNTPTKTLSNLSQNQDFQVYVRSICAAGETSYWVGPFTVEAINAMSANVDTVAFVPTEVTAGITTVEEMEYIEVSGTNEDGNTISVFVKKSLAVGTYHDSPDVLLSYTVDGDELTADPTTPPTVTITEKTPHSMVGTFSFSSINETETATTTYTITNGSFAVTF